MKRILFLLVTLFLTLAASAQKWMDSVPETYQTKDCQEVASASSACNQGEEPFSAFLRKFNMSPRYRESRIKFTDNTLEFLREDNMFATMLSHLKDYGVLPLRAVKSKSRLATWHNVSENMVCYYGPGVLLCFERIDGKWYVTGVNLAG